VIGEIIMENYKDQPLVSVGIPTYNRPEGLRRTLECMTQQTYNNLEIIVSDNCSPGRETEAVVREFMEQDSRIQYYLQDENKGMAFNFQFVLEKSTGKYFMWASDDDEWEPSYVSCMVEVLESNPDAVLSFCRFEYTYAYRQPLTRIDKRSKIIGLSRFYRLLYTSCLMPKMATSHYIFGLIRRDVLLKCGGIETRVDIYNGADMVTVFHLLYYGKFIRVDELLYHCGQGQRGAFTESSVQKLSQQSFQTLVIKYLKWLMGWHQYYHIHRVIIKKTSLKYPQKIVIYAVLYINELLFYLNSLTQTLIRYALNRPHAV